MRASTYALKYCKDFASAEAEKGPESIQKRVASEKPICIFVSSDLLTG
jgi:hypothetical protein